MKATTFFARRADKRLGDDVRHHLVRLFAEHSARVVDNDELVYLQERSFDYAVATVSTPDLDLRFVRVRGQFEIEISAPLPNRKWDALDSALLWIEMQRDVPTKAEVPSWGYGSDWATLDWQSIDEFLVENFFLLIVAASARPILDRH